MIRLTALIRRIVRKIRKVNKTALSATLGAIFLPLAVYLLIEGRAEDRWLALSMFFSAILLLIFTMIMVLKSDNRDRSEKISRDKVEFNRFMLQTRISAEILKELEQLNNEGDAGISAELLKQLERLENKDDDER